MKVKSPSLDRILWLLWSKQTKIQRKHIKRRAYDENPAVCFGTCLFPDGMQMTKCNIWVTNKLLSYCSHAGNGRGVDVEYELSCTNTIMARQSCCDDDWVDVSRKPFKTILDHNTPHYMSVCVLLRLNKPSPWTLIISTSEKKQWITHTHTCKATLCALLFSISLKFCLQK